MHPEKNEQQGLEQNIVYSLAQRLDLPTEDLISLGLSPILLKINSLKNREDNNIDLVEVSGETFSTMIKMLHKFDVKYQNNLDVKDDYSHYTCYVSQNGSSGFCINQDTKEFCNFFSVQKGLGTKLLGYALENYDCLGIANALPETYENYYQGRFDVITHHWEENWDYPGDKDKAVWFGYILPKGVLSEEDRVSMLRLGQASKRQALSEQAVKDKVKRISKGKTDSKDELTEVQSDRLNMELSVLSPAQEEILHSALTKCYLKIKNNQQRISWEEWEVSSAVIASQIQEMWSNKRFNVK